MVLNNIKKVCKIIVVLGPTAVGKSDIAVRLAKKIGGEVISADSRQVYKGLDIGTGKITKKETRGIPHHLLDVISSKRQFTVAEYVRIAKPITENICVRGGVPIVCGGTGFYIDALLGKVPIINIPPDRKLREELEKYITEKLFKKLQKLDSARAKTIDINNRRRLIRAIEIASTKKHMNVSDIFTHARMNYSILKIGLTLPSETLKEKISIRLFARIRDGMVEEVKQLHKKGLSWKRMEELGLEYRYLARYLQEKISKKEMETKLKTQIWRYAKRQMTWFKRDKKVKWYTPNEYKKIEKLVENFLKT